MNSIVIDLDHTICIPDLEMESTFGRYALAKPVPEIIDKMKELKYDGYKIIISTSRRMLTHDGDINKIVEDVGQITIDWLEENGVPYDELIWGKPYSSTYYVDDKAMTPSDFVKWDIS